MLIRDRAVTLAVLAAGITTAAKLHKYVDPFTGTPGTVQGTGYNGGSAFPGEVVPFGMVKLGPDVATFYTSIGANAGYLPDGNGTSKSLTHVSRVGGGRVHGIVCQMPLLNLDGVKLVDNLTYRRSRSGNDAASAGIFRPTFKDGLITELSVSSNMQSPKMPRNLTSWSIFLIICRRVAGATKLKPTAMEQSKSHLMRKPTLGGVCIVELSVTS